MAKGVPQANGEIAIEPMMDANEVADARQGPARCDAWLDTA